MTRTTWRCACAAALLGMLPQLATAAPDYFSWTGAGSKYARALALNNQGHYAVNSFGPETPYQGAGIIRQRFAESVGGLGGYITQVRALNDLDQAVGLSTTATGEDHAFLYAEGHMQDLTARYGIQDARDINKRGEIAARSPDFRAAVLRDGVVDIVGPEYSGPGDINERGEVLVSYDVYDNGFGSRTAVYSQGMLTELPRFGGSPVSGQAINDAGWVNTRIDRDADLLLIAADEINDRGQILAHRCDRTGVFCYGSVLLDPVPAVPEPSTLAMLLAGLGLAAALPPGRALRRRRTAA